jgi:hypothetical protein
MDWLGQHMSGYRANTPSATPTKKIVSFRAARSIAVNSQGVETLDLVHQAADMIRAAEDHAADIETRARALADRAVEELKLTKEQIGCVESDRDALKALLLEAQDRAFAAEDALRQSGARIAILESQLAEADLRASSADMRACEAENVLRRVEDAIRAEILEPRRSTSVTSVAA